MEIDNVYEPPILKLDTDCFHAIFSYLDVEEQYYLAKTCQKIQDFFRCYICYGQNGINFCGVNKEEIEEVLKFLLNSGAKAKSIKATGDTFTNIRSQFLYILTKHFQNLIQLKLTDFQVFSSLAIRKLMGTLSNLKELSLVRCELNDVHCLYLQQCTKLEKLDLSENYVITAKYLDKFPNLVHLNLNYCRNVKPIFFVMLCKISKLKHLHIAFCDCLNEVSFRGMVKYLTEVDTLTISGTHRCKKLKLLSRLPKLKNFEIHGLHKVKPGLFQQLLDRKSNILEKLTIVGNKLDTGIYKMDPIFNFSNIRYLNIKYLPCLVDDWLRQIAEMDSLQYLGCAGCKNITNNGVISVIVKLQNLTEIDVSFCTQLGVFIVKELCDKLKEKDKSKKITMHVGGTHLDIFLAKGIGKIMYSDNLELTSFKTLPIESIRHSLFRKPAYI